MELFKVVIIESESNSIVQEFKPDSLRNCERIKSGVEINLNHDDYYVDILEVD
jgi:hypothetical protein